MKKVFSTDLVMVAILCVGCYPTRYDKAKCDGDVLVLWDEANISPLDTLRVDCTAEARHGGCRQRSDGTQWADCVITSEPCPDGYSGMACADDQLGSCEGGYGYPEITDYRSVDWYDETKRSFVDCRATGKFCVQTATTGACSYEETPCDLEDSKPFCRADVLLSCSRISDERGGYDPNGQGIWADHLCSDRGAVCLTGPEEDAFCSDAPAKCSSDFGLPRCFSSENAPASIYLCGYSEAWELVEACPENAPYCVQQDEMTAECSVLPELCEEPGATRFYEDITTDHKFVLRCENGAWVVQEACPVGVAVCVETEGVARCE